MIKGYISHVFKISLIIYDKSMFTFIMNIWNLKIEIHFVEFI